MVQQVCLTCNKYAVLIPSILYDPLSTKRFLSKDQEQLSTTNCDPKTKQKRGQERFKWQNSDYHTQEEP